MNEREFYQQVLGLNKPWKVKAVRMELKQRQIVVEVECEEQFWGNPGTGARAHIHEWNLRRWRHLDTCQFETLIEARVPRLRYEDGHTEEVTVPWAERYSRLSKLMESFVIRVVESCHTVKEAAGLLGLGVDQVDGVMRRAVQRGLERRAAEPMKYLGMDEKSIGRGARHVIDGKCSDDPAGCVLNHSRISREPETGDQQGAPHPAPESAAPLPPCRARPPIPPPDASPRASARPRPCGTAPPAGIPPPARRPSAHETFPYPETIGNQDK